MLPPQASSKSAITRATAHSILSSHQTPACLRAAKQWQKLGHIISSCSCAGGAKASNAEPRFAVPIASC